MHSSFLRTTKFFFEKIITVLGIISAFLIIIYLSGSIVLQYFYYQKLWKKIVHYKEIKRIYI